MPKVPHTGEAVLELVRRAEIAEEAVLASFLKQYEPLPDSAADTATKLVVAGILTPFQARLILQGKHRGFKLGQYIILNQIGAGGMGSVFLAEHTTLKRKVALKVLPTKQAADPANVERFYREARAAATLDHPNIVHAYDVVLDKGTLFLVLEYIDGHTLDRKLAAGRLHPGEAVNYIVQAAAGLQHAHEKGVAHRDIKPANLLVGRNGIVKILDLGLAHFFVDSSPNLGRSGEVMGTADYIAPEQLLDNVTLDHRVDIYNLGATLYHLLTGQPPFTGTLTAKMLAHHMSVVTPAHELCEDVPRALSDVVAKMLAKNPADRYQMAAEVVQALLPFVDVPDRTGLSSGRLPAIAAIAVAESTASLHLGPAMEAALAINARLKKQLRLALAGLGVTFLLVVILLIIALTT